MKKSKRSSEDVKEHFPAWEQKKSLLVRMGGCYANTHSPLFSINQIPQIVVGKNETGLLSLSFELRNRQDQVLVRMEQNWLTAYPSNIHDMIVTPKTKEVKVWFDKEDVGLVLSFRRVTINELDQLLGRDREKQEKIAAVKMQEQLAQMPQEHRKFVEQALQEGWSQPTRLPAVLDDLSEDLREAVISEDQVGTLVKRWAERHCAMDDGLIPLLDFEQMAIYHHGERLTIKDGVAGFLYYSAAFNSQRGAINVRCPCPICSPQGAA